MDLLKVIIGPKITEKTMMLSQSGKYTLLIDKKANKHQVKESLVKNFKVDPIKINIVSIKEKGKITQTKMGRLVSKRKAYKKAIVILKKNQKIQGFETEK
jgi:large subunit ribosomal protein L23